MVYDLVQDSDVKGARLDGFTIKLRVSKSFSLEADALHKHI
jgi:hypothetical protein